jgi:beta-glucosidase
MYFPSILLSFIIPNQTLPNPFSWLHEPFAWGVATASYQIEGGSQEGGRGPSIWDTFSHTPGKTANGDTGDVADDSYHLYRKDIDLVSDLGTTHYRFSLSWSRILPTGELPINREGVTYYNNMIDYMLSKNITPFVTLYHWDLPQSLEDRYAGWLNKSMATTFTEYARVCFDEFGDRVKHWITFNEPLTFTTLGYGGSCIHAPGKCVNPSRDPYIVAHHILLAHGKTVALYRNHNHSQDGEIGITLNCDWGEPMTSSENDKKASVKYLESQLSWFADPVFFGKYPDSMLTSLGERLPTFTEDEIEMLRGSWDYFGLNHYTSNYVYHQGDNEWGVTATGTDGKMIGEQADSSWLKVVPWGFKKLLLWVAERYGNPGIYVTENGCDVPNESSMSLQDALNDTFRIDFYRGYLANMVEAMIEGVRVKGYFAWSLLDNFEWADGYTKRFGLHYVDYANGLQRYKKASAEWYKNYIVSFKK